MVVEVPKIKVAGENIVFQIKMMFWMKKLNNNKAFRFVRMYPYGYMLNAHMNKGTLLSNVMPSLASC